MTHPAPSAPVSSSETLRAAIRAIPLPEPEHQWPADGFYSFSEAQVDALLEAAAELVPQVPAEPASALQALAAAQRPLPADMAQILADNAWDLYARDNAPAPAEPVLVACARCQSTNLVSGLVETNRGPNVPPGNWRAFMCRECGAVHGATDMPLTLVPAAAEPAPDTVPREEWNRIRDVVEGLRKTIHGWHDRAVALGADGVEDVLRTAEICKNIRMLQTKDGFIVDWKLPAAEPAPGVAESRACPRCNGSGVVDDGEIDCYEDGTPYTNGPVKCVKDCPSCNGTGKTAASPAIGVVPWAGEKLEALFVEAAVFGAQGDISGGKIEAKARELAQRAVGGAA